jgi:hypothetical protein
MTIRPIARRAAEWEIRRLGLDHSATVGLTVDTLTTVFEPLVDELLDMPEAQDEALRRKALQLLEAASDEHC